MLVKIFNLKQKISEILPAAMGKTKFCLFKKTASFSFRLKHIHTYSCIFRCIQTYPHLLGIIHGYSGIILAYSEPWVTLTYSELLYIQNPVISETLTHSEPETYSESWAIQNPGIFRTRGILRTLSNICSGVHWETANSYNYFDNL